jgi:hypothetical protein
VLPNLQPPNYGPFTFHATKHLGEARLQASGEAMRTSWFIWLVVTVLVGLYVAAGHLASRTEKVAIKLERGYSAQVGTIRLDEDRLRMRLIFQGNHVRRPELGDWNTNDAGTLKFGNPGAAIRIVVSVPGAAPVTYEAMPMSARGSGTIIRNLTASLSIAPGVWRWPPDRNELVLQRGRNTVNVEVVAVEAPLVGEAVELWVDPALGFKATMPNVGWLWLSFLWPILLAIQVLWAILLGVRTWRIRREAR